MRIITWNANRKMRWDLLWGERSVKAMSWEFIMLQETGEPQTEWSLVDSCEAAKRTDIPAYEESFLYWVYSYQPANYGTPLYITFVRWPGRQKNHVIIITRLRPSAVVNASNDMAIRPVAAVLAEIDTNGQKSMVLIGCIHVVASGNAPTELRELTPQLREHCRNAGANKWVLVGDFNCDPAVAVSAMNAGMKLPNGSSPVSYAPDWPTHRPTKTTKDYVMASDNTALGTSATFIEGRVESDHVMVICDFKSAQLVGLPFRKENRAENDRKLRPKTPRRYDINDLDSGSAQDSQSEYQDNPPSDSMDDT